jgi:hypothetical protein
VSERLRSVLLNLLALLALAAVGLWLMNNTEWVEEREYQPPTGEARGNPLYVAQQLARALGAKVERHNTLAPMPPAGATLVLVSSEQEVRALSGREALLRQWVEQGGHLVVNASMLGWDNLSDWLPVRWAEQKSASGSNKCRVDNTDASVSQDDAENNASDGNEGESDSGGNDENADAAGASSDSNADDRSCRQLSETGAAAGPGFRVCDGYPLEAKPGAVSLWSATGPDGAELLRVKLGQGDVTASSVDMDNDAILKADNAEAFAAALRLAPGMTLWFIDEADPEPLFVWLWQRAWIVFVLGFLALAAALWRGLPRFGPRQALPALERRSMAEQIIGAAHFLAQNDPQALHQAALRVFMEAAAERLPRNYSSLTENARAALIARLTGQTIGELADALGAHQRSPARLEVDLRCLETAARRLRERPLHP